MAKRRSEKAAPPRSTSNFVFSGIALLILGAFVGSALSTAWQSTSGGGTNVAQGQESDLAAQIKVYSDRVALNPKDGNAWITLGNLYFDTDQPAKSVEAYARALEINPNNPNVLTDMGVMHRALGQYPQALDAFARAIAVDPSHETARFNTGIVRLYDLNDKAGAAEAWEGLARVNPQAVTPNGESVAELARKLRSDMGSAPTMPPQAQTDSKPRLLSK
jgi:cytochrome c-type biogenesis protein CcmH/NrfG